MSPHTTSNRLSDLLYAPGAPLFNWRDIIAEIDGEVGSSPSSEQRVALLELFKSTMDVVENALAKSSPDELAVFREARLKHYKILIVQECVVGGQVCTETLNAATSREISAGRMSPDDNLRRIAEMSMAAPHLTRAELIAMAADSPGGIIAISTNDVSDGLKPAGRKTFGWFRSLRERLWTSAEQREIARRRELGYKD